MICLENLSFSYSPKNFILRDINLQISRGESVAIVGPSGSGKSTLLHVMACFLKPELGKLFIDGIDMSRLNDFGAAVVRNQKIGFVFQQFHLMPKTSVINNVLLPTQYPCEIKKSGDFASRALNLASNLGFVDELNKKPNQLSGGQQQRVAIARALINDADIILADEPTGNLDSQNAKQVIDLLKRLNDEGKTVVIITHDREIAARFDSVYEMHDGRIVGSKDASLSTRATSPFMLPKPSLFFALRHLLPLAWANIWRHGMRSVLTMLGIAIGIAAILVAATLGEFSKNKMLASFAELGVNTIQFSAYPNFNLTATESVPAIFRGLDVESDLKPLKRLFPNIKKMAPQSHWHWSNTITYGGKSIGPNIVVAGVAENTFSIMNWPLKMGSNFFPYHVEMKSPVCIIGTGVEEDLFKASSPLEKIIHISEGSSSHTCRIIGVLTKRTSNKPFDTAPNHKVFLPYSTLQAIPTEFYPPDINNALIEIEEGSNIEKTGQAIVNFFAKKYGKSGEFQLGFDATLIGQMNKFLNIFSLVLIAIAFLCLGVGGIGIANMMLVSLAERFKEIGLRKAVGATNVSIRFQLLLESLFLCFLAGIIGLVLGFVGYEAAIFGATKLVANLEFEWIINKSAVILSLISIVVVGLLSGLVPAIKAERLEIAEALRAE